jgi:hypothetical protein
MVEVASSTKDYIVEHMEASEKWMKAHTSSIGKRINLCLAMNCGNDRHRNVFSHGTLPLSKLFSNKQSYVLLNTYLR